MTERLLPDVLMEILIENLGEYDAEKAQREYGLADRLAAAAIVYKSALERDQPPKGEYRVGNHSPVNIWFERPGYVGQQVGMACSASWARRVVAALNQASNAEPAVAGPQS